MKRPVIVCLCGSTAFSDAFQRAQLEETLAGRIVLTVGCVTQRLEHDPEIKAKLDELHLRKIDLADEVLFLNVGGYMGTSTKNELEYAMKEGKTIRFLNREEGERYLEEA